MTGPLNPGGAGEGGPAFPDPALFNPNATRGAVLRGLTRTAALVVTGFVLFSLVGTVVGYAAFQFNNRDGAFDRVGVVGFAVAHPGVAVPTQFRGTQSWGWLRTTKTTQYLQPDGSYREVQIRMNTLGAITAGGELTSKLDQALTDGRASPSQARTFVTGLPPSAISDVIVDFAVPLTERELSALNDRLNDLHVFGSIRFYDDPFTGARRRYRNDTNSIHFDESANDRPVTWGEDFSFYRYRNFTAWTRSLRSSDDGNLNRLGLPSSTYLKNLGRQALVHGLYLQNITQPQLAQLLEDRSVRTVTPVDVRFTILSRDQS